MARNPVSKQIKIDINNAMEHESQPLSPELVEKLQADGLLDRIIFDDDTPLTFACKAGLTTSVMALLYAGANPGVVNRWGHCPLMWASDDDGKLPIAIALIDAGADLEQTKQRADRPLHTACFVGATEIIKELIKRGADIDAPGQEGWQPIHLACRIGHVKLVRLLIERGSDLGRKVMDQHKKCEPIDICLTWSFVNPKNHLECAGLITQALRSQKEHQALQKATEPRARRVRITAVATTLDRVVNDSDKAGAGKMKSKRIRPRI